MLSMLRSRCIQALFLVAICTTTGWAESNVRMVTSTRECTTEARLVAPAIIDPKRDQNSDTKSVEKKTEQNEKIRNEKKASCGAALAFNEQGTNADILARQLGEILLDSDHLAGTFTGELVIGGMNVLPGTVGIEMSSLYQLKFEIDGPAEFNFLFDLDDLSFNQIPFLLRLDQLSGDAASLVSETLVMPAPGLQSRSLFVPSAGLFQMTLTWQLPEVFLPAGNDTTGIETFDVQWAVVPEPASCLLLALGLLIPFRQRR